MARKDKSSPADLIIQLGSLLPWWLALVLALVSYVALHAYATSPIPPLVPGKAAASVIPMMLKGIAGAAQYFLPILLCFAALLSFLKRGKTEQGQTDNSTFKPSRNSKPGGTPPCPVCSGSMVMRKAKRGSNAGSAFWGCCNFPQCKGTKVLG